MTEQINEQSLKDQFPFYNQDERAVLRELLITEPNSVKYTAAKGKLLELIYSDLVKFYQWDTTQDKRVDIRRRLLNISNLFVVIPINELRELSRKAKLTLKKVVYETHANPLEMPLVEMHSYDVKYIEIFSKVFSQVELLPETSALDFITGNREKRQHPRTQFTVFRKNVQDEVISKEYLTASAEPLTHTQIISLFDPEGKPRDLLTIGFDLVFESAFVDFFHHAPAISPITIQRNSHVMGKQFLLNAMEKCMALKNSKANLSAEFPLYFEEAERTNQKILGLLYSVLKGLLPQITERIKGWNKQLDLEPNNELIHWEES